MRFLQKIAVFLLFTTVVLPLQGLSMRQYRQSRPYYRPYRKKSTLTKITEPILWLPKKIIKSPAEVCNFTGRVIRKPVKYTGRAIKKPAKYLVSGLWSIGILPIRAISGTYRTTVRVQNETIFKTGSVAKFVKVPYQGRGYHCGCHALVNAYVQSRKINKDTPSIAKQTKLEQMRRMYSDPNAGHIYKLAKMIKIHNITAIVHLPYRMDSLEKFFECNGTYTKNFKKALYELAHKDETIQRFCLTLSGGHWIGVVAHKKNKKITYYQMDSYFQGNDDLRFDLVEKLDSCVKQFKKGNYTVE